MVNQVKRITYPIVCSTVSRIEIPIARDDMQKYHQVAEIRRMDCLNFNKPIFSFKNDIKLF